MLTIANRRERFFAPVNLTAAQAILASAGLLLIWLLAPPYQNSSGSIKPPQWKARSSRPSRSRRRATPAAKPGGFAPAQPGELSAGHPRVDHATAVFGLPSSVKISLTTRATATSHVLA